MSPNTTMPPSGPQYRTATIARAAVDEKSRTVELAVSSELAVERYFGLEVLSHRAGAIRLDRLRTAGPLLMDHDPTDQVGTVESVRLDVDHVLRARVRFGNSARAGEVFRDVADGIRKTVSVGYLIHKMEPSGNANGRDVYRATDWEPLEITLTAVPADPSVGVGRTLAAEGSNSMNTNTEPEVRAEDDRPSRRERRESFDQQRRRETEIATILDLGKRHDRQELAADHVQRGTPLEKFSRVLLDSIGTEFLHIDDRSLDEPASSASMRSLGMTKTEMSRYSLVRVLRALKDQKFMAQAGIELEVHRALEKEGSRVNRGGMLVPHDALIPRRRSGWASDRAMSTAVGAGGEFQPLEVAGFIETLSEESIAIRAGVRTLPVDGVLQLPRFDVDLVGAWVPEDTDATPETPTTGAITLDPHLAIAVVPVTHKLMKTATPEIEDMIVFDIRRAIGSLVDQAVLAGSGSLGQPLGVLNTSGIGVVDATAGFGFTEILEAMQEVADAEGESGRLAWIVPPILRTKLSQLPAITGGEFPVWSPGIGKASLAGVPAHVSTKIPVGATTRAIYGNWSDAVLATWGALELAIDGSTKFLSAGLLYRGLMDADVGVRHPGSFCVVSNIATS